MTPRICLAVALVALLGACSRAEKAAPTRPAPRRRPRHRPTSGKSPGCTRRTTAALPPPSRRRAPTASRCSCTGARCGARRATSVKSTIFSRADFVERSARFVPVYLDGDTASAQKYGKRTASAATRRRSCSAPTAPRSRAWQARSTQPSTCSCSSTAWPAARPRSRR